VLLTQLRINVLRPDWVSGSTIENDRVRVGLRQGCEAAKFGALGELRIFSVGCLGE
jgi:hypothetical protein